MADVRAMRVHHARQLILGSAVPLKEVAGLTGLGNEYSLSRTFRQCLGIPPGKLRRFHRG
jgi:transcriptional regulator GlxA family with amidase domain